MRTLQEKYNGIQEGKFSKDHFLAEARMQQPQLVTRFNGYDDAVQILKNRGMIQEAAKVTSKSYKGLKYEIQYEAPKGYKVVGVGELEKAIGSPKFYKTSEEAKERAESDIKDYLGEKEPVNEVTAVKENAVKAHMEKLIQAAKTGNKTKESILAGFAGADIHYKVTNAEPNVIKYWNDEQGLEGEIKLKEPVKEARLTKNNLTDYRYKPTNEMDKYPYEQILRGIRVELEVAGVFGTPTAEEYAKALAKVSKNLAKDSIFYTNQLAGVNPKVDLHDKMVDATAKNTVDTFNGMKKAALKEDHSKNPNDKYTVKTCDMEGTPWAVWEGKKKVKGFATKAEAKEYADKQNKKQGLSESVLKEGIKNLIKKVLSEEVIEFGEGEGVYEMYGSGKRIPDDTYIGDDTWYQDDEIDYNDEDEYEMYGDDEADDITHRIGQEEETDAETFDDLFKENKSEEELRAEWEKHQATSHPEDKMSYMEWRSEQGLDEAIDTEADKNMVRKFMKMYETDPSKFERLHKQAETQAATTKDRKFKHLLRLLNRAKAGSVQPKEIPSFKGTRDALDNLFESVSLKDIL